MTQACRDSDLLGHPVRRVTKATQGCQDSQEDLGAPDKMDSRGAPDSPDLRVTEALVPRAPVGLRGLLASTDCPVPRETAASPACRGNRAGQGSTACRELRETPGIRDCPVAREPRAPLDRDSQELKVLQDLRDKLDLKVHQGRRETRETTEPQD